MGIVEVNCRRAENSLLYLWTTAAYDLQFGKGRSPAKMKRGPNGIKKAASQSGLFTRDECFTQLFSRLTVAIIGILAFIVRFIKSLPWVSTLIDLLESSCGKVGINLRRG